MNDIPQTDSGVSLRISTYRYSSLVYLRNNRPVLWNLIVSTTRDLEDASIRIRLTPDFCQEQRISIPELRAGDDYRLQGVCPVFDDARLQNLHEDTDGHITVDVVDAQGNLLARREDDFKWLAYNCWAGGNEYPELLAALTLPNDPAVDTILNDTKNALHLDGDWQGYNETAADIRTKLTALWDTLGSYHIHYALPPESWIDDGVGQRVRTPSCILESKCSTCLDSTLMMAACTARMGYNPFVILTEGHAFIGIMTENRFLPSPQLTPAANIRNLMQQNKLLVVETTALNTHNGHDALLFEQAVNAGIAQLMHVGDNDYFQALDIRKLWQECNIHPIFGGDLHDVVSAPPAKDEDILVSTEPKTRIENWQLKLLDLSLRNNLLNTRVDGKRQLQLLLPDVGTLEDILAAGGSFRIKSIPETYWTITSQYQHGAASAETEARLEECVRSMFQKNELVSTLRDSELQKVLQGLYNTTKREMEESGANTLYVACGFLKWYRKDSHERAYHAPLLLLPVRLTRPSVRAGYTLRYSDEETRFNSTLLELLKTEFEMRIPELEGDLPTDSSGLDVAKIFAIIRKAITAQPGWEVIETCSLGTFSFTKFLMWKDMVDRRADLLRNPIVCQIAAEQRSVFPEQVGFPNVRNLDNEVQAAKVFTPLSADSSQLSAILAAGRGKSFVLIGPPGTGKSQTITNMIAHCLAHGKTVLFVAEKSAALQVVHNRLKRIGLEDFCLELHSNKANKKGVLKQFKAAVETISAGAKEDAWDETTYSMAELRYKLNLLPWEMHKKYPNGTSLFDDITLISAHGDIPVFKPTHTSAQEITREQQTALLAEANEIAHHYGLIKDIPTGIRERIRHTEFTHAWEDELAQHLSTYRDTAEKKQRVIAELRSQLRLSADADAEALSALLPALDKYGHDESMVGLLPSRAAETLRTLQLVLPHAEEYAQNHAQLSLDYPERTLNDPELDRLLSECRMATVSWFLPRFFAMRRISRMLQLMAGDNRTPNCLRDLQALQIMREAKKAVAGINSDSLPETFRKGVALTQQDVTQAKDIAAAFRPAVGEWEAVAVSLLTDKSGKLAACKHNIDLLQQYSDELRRETQELNRLTGQEQPAWDAAIVEQLLANRHQWRAIVLWNHKLSDTQHDDTQTLAHVELQEGLSPEGLALAVQVNLARLRVRAASDAQDTLRHFSGLLQEGLIHDFRQADTAVIQATASHIRQLLIRRAKTAQYGTETALLQRELSKQRAHLPLRRLISSIPHLLPQLKPCLLMSPLSVAQYLDTNTEPFDIVIFDEASQIPVWDAIGAIARGQNAVIVGDPRQMPPTSFFSRSKTEDDSELNGEQDLESILDECIACAIPMLNLTWHYRSKSESLIAFSNRNYYEKKLSTFPAPVVKDKALQYHYIGGIYESGATKRINKAEAKALVKHVIETLKQPDFRYTEATSIGIVTFNAQQQGYIEELLEQERLNDESLEPFFSENNAEAVFVKNLENVQGDERGIIYFSTTYGPDAKGHLSMNFGPLNLAGGERRLNVAITRARNAMHVFSSLKPDDIDLNRTQARGAADLRNFLDYARRGAENYLRVQAAEGREDETDLAHMIAAKLSERGWKCKCNIGISDYRIDIAVENPDIEGEIMAGICLDGKSYASAATARDRDILRNSVLTMLGWRLISLWSIEWWQHPDICLEQLNNKLKECQAMGAVQQAELPSLIEAAETTEAPLPEIKSEYTEEVIPLVGDPYPVYRPDMSLPPLFEMSDASITPHILHLVDTEAPIKADFLMTRLRDLSELTPALTSPVKKRLATLIGELAKQGLFSLAEEKIHAHDAGTPVVYRFGQLEAKPRQKGPRNWSDIPDSELMAVADLVLAHRKCMRGCDEHLKDIATYFGINRLTAPFKAHLSELLQAGDAYEAAYADASVSRS